MVEYNVTLKEPDKHGSDLTIMIRREGHRGSIIHKEEHTLVFLREDMEAVTISGFMMILRGVMGHDSLPSNS